MTTKSETEVAEKIAYDIVGEIISNLNERSGFDDWWWNIDSETRTEINSTLKDIAVALLHSFAQSVREGEREKVRDFLLGFLEDSIQQNGYGVRSVPQVRILEMPKLMAIRRESR